MPFDKYESFQDCVKQNKDKKNPEAFCSALHKKVTGKYPAEKSFTFFTDKFETETIDIKGQPHHYTVGYFTSTERDLVNDICTPFCIDDMLAQIKGRNIKLDIEHESFRGDTQEEKELNKSKIPIAKIVDSGRDGNKAWIKGEVNPHHSRFNEVWNSLKDGFLDAHSIAYIPVRTAERKGTDGIDERILDKVNLLNVAYTGNPINTDATMADVMVKSLEALKDDEEGLHIEKEESEMSEKMEVKDSPVEEKLKALEERVLTLESKGESKPEASAEGEAEAPKETSEAAPAEKKPEAPLEEVKAELDTLKKEFKDFVSQPQYKAVQEDMKTELSEVEETKSKDSGPLDIVR